DSTTCLHSTRCPALASSIDTQRERNSLAKNRMREICTSGSVGGEGRKVLTYPANDSGSGPGFRFAPSGLHSDAATPLPTARIRDHTARHQPVPDEQHHQRADGGGDEARALVGAVMADRLADEG